MKSYSSAFSSDIDFSRYPDSVATACELMKIESTADNTDALHEAVRFVKNFFLGTGAAIKIYEHSGKPSIVVSNTSHSGGEGKNFDAILLGHLDVVPAPREAFIPRIEGGRLFGRGACDMKSEIAVMMHLMKEILATPISRNIALILTTDEEVGGHSGAGHLADDIGYTAGVVLVPDGGADIDEIVLRNKGVLLLKIVAEGKAAHGARPWLGENAIEKVSRVCEEIQTAVENFHLSPRDVSGDVSGEVSGEVSGGQEIWHDGEEAHWHNTCTLGMIAGGKAINQVPDEATAFLDVRFIEGVDADKLFARIEEIAAANGCRASVVMEGNMSEVPREQIAVQKYAAVIEKHTEKRPRFCRAHGSDDSRFFTKKGIPALVSVPLSGGRHSENEWVDLASLDEFSRIYRNFLREM